MELLLETFQWLTDAARWQLELRDAIPRRTAEHLWVSSVAMGIAALVTLPTASLLAHFRKAEAAASSVVNIGRAIPSFGLIVMFWLFASRAGISTQFWPLVLALVALAMPPMFTNTYAAIRSVDTEVVEAAQGMGMTAAQVIRSVEIPLAASVIAVGVRIAFVQVIATTAIGAIVTDGGGLGRYIVGGFAQGRAGWPMVLGGALVLAVMTLVVDRILHSVEYRLTVQSGALHPSPITEAVTGAAG